MGRWTPAPVPSPPWTFTATRSAGLGHNPAVDRETSASATLERGGCSIHYWLRGPAGAPVIVLMHGAGMDHRMFAAQEAALLPAFRVLTWDARGHGRSQPVDAAITLDDYVDDLVAILDREGVDAAVIGGQSFGGYIAQHMALRHPERVRALVVIGATSIALPVPRHEHLALRLVGPLLRIWPYRSFVATAARSTALRPEVQAYAAAAMLEISPRGFARVWAAVAGAVSPRGIPGYRVPVPLLFVHGEHDRAGTIRRDAPRWRAAEPSMTYLVVADAAHNANQDNPAAFNAALLEFLARLP